MKVKICVTMLMTHTGVRKTLPDGKVENLESGFFLFKTKIIAYELPKLRRNTNYFFALPRFNGYLDFRNCF